MSDRLVLLLAAVGLVPIALSYGMVPSKSLPYLLDISVEGTNHTHVFRAIMGLYLVNVLFWLAGAVMPALRRPALWVLFLFMAGLAAGRLLSLVLDGVPSFVLIFYLVAELLFAALALKCLRAPA
jgi:low temperature requirement protein LtrA